MNKPVTIPRNLVRLRVVDMEEGEKFWVSSKAVHADEDFGLWVDGSFDTWPYTGKDGIAIFGDVLLERTGDGFEVSLSKNQRIERRGFPNFGTSLPVVKVSVR